nr:MAG TPA: hypothetical protein [Microviridae sp.]
MMVVSTLTTWVLPLICTEADEAQEAKDETPKNPAIAVIIYSKILQISLINSLFIIQKPKIKSQRKNTKMGHPI